MCQFPLPTIGDAGNSYHALYHIDLPNDAESTALIKACLEAAALRFSDDVVTVDCTNFNASRIWKLYGTLSRKGDHVAGRPHRVSRILSVPPEVVVVPLEKLWAFADSMPQMEPGEAPKRGGSSGPYAGFDLEGFMARYGIVALYSGPWGDAEKFVLEVCPFNAEHTDRSAVITRRKDGMLGFKCQHHGCINNHWKELRNLLEPYEDDGSRLIVRPRTQDGRERERTAEPAPGPATEPSGLPTILTTNRQLRDVADDALEAIRRFNTPEPTIFHYGNMWARLGEDSVQPEILTPVSLKGVLARAASFERMSKDGPVPTRPPQDLSPDLLSFPKPGLPTLTGVSTTPIFLTGGTLLRTTGYDEGSCLMMRLHGLEHVRTDMLGHEARHIIQKELFGDFPLVDDSSLAHAIAFLLVRYVRRLIDGPTPAHMIDAPGQGSGKGLLCEVITLVVTGQAVSVSTLSSNNEEMEKKITSILLEAPQFVLLDNAEVLHSTVMAALLTADIWAGRVLGHSRMAHLPNQAVWAVTGNNIETSTELSRRVVSIRLDARKERPEERTNFRHRNLPRWVRENRCLITSACLSLIQAWIDAGQPDGKEVLGRYESWARVIGGILDVAGIEGFLQDRKRVHNESEKENREWEAICERWAQAYPHGDAISAGTLFRVILAPHGLLLGVWGGYNDTAAMQRVGHALARKRDHVFGNWVIRPAGRDGATGNLAYRLDFNEPDGASGVSDDDSGVSSTDKAETPERPRGAKL